MRRRQFKYKQPHYIIPSLISISCATFWIAYISWTTQYELLNVVIFSPRFCAIGLQCAHHEKCPYVKARSKEKKIKKGFDQWPYPVVILVFFRYEFCSVCSVFGAFIFHIRIRSIQNSMRQYFFFFFFFSLGEPVIFCYEFSVCHRCPPYFIRLTTLVPVAFNVVCINLTQMNIRNSTTTKYAICMKSLQLLGNWVFWFIIVPYIMLMLHAYIICFSFLLFPSLLLFTRHILNKYIFHHNTQNLCFTCTQWNRQWKFYSDSWVFLGLGRTHSNKRWIHIVSFLILRARELGARCVFFPLLFNLFGRAIRKMHCISVTVFSNFQCTREHKVYEMGFGHCVKMWRETRKKKSFFLHINKFDCEFACLMVNFFLFLPLLIFLFGSGAHYGKINLHRTADSSNKRETTEKQKIGVNRMKKKNKNKKLK